MTTTHIWLALTCALTLIISGCADPRDCHIETLNYRHPGELSAVLETHPALIMDMLKVITDLEKEAGGYR